MLIVTGGAGFIGSNLVRKLNSESPEASIVIVDDLLDGQKFKNLVDCNIVDYWDKYDFLKRIQLRENLPHIKAIFHQGACTDTKEWDGKYMMENNFEYSKTLLHYCLDQRIPLIYASSAAVYGVDKHYKEGENERPINVYGYSKLLFDNYVLRLLPTANSQVIGLRYFNVYGPRENHKKEMASVAMNLYFQLQQGEIVKLFEGSDGYENGEQRRDFIYVEDIVDINLWCFNNPQVRGIFNAGTGQSESFNTVAQSLLDYFKRGSIEYIPFPPQLRRHYQSYTQANISKLQYAGYKCAFTSIQEGIKKYIEWLDNNYKKK